MLRERKLHYEAVHVGVVVQLIDFLEEFLFCYIGFVTQECRGEAAFFACFYLVGNIGFAASVVPYKYGCEVRTLAAIGDDAFDFCRNLLLYGCCYSLAVNKLHRFMFYG